MLLTSLTQPWQKLSLFSEVFTLTQHPWLQETTEVVDMQQILAEIFHLFGASYQLNTVPVCICR